MAYWRIEPAKRGMQFSRSEVMQILLAMAALTLAFTVAQVGGIRGLVDGLRLGGGLYVAYVALGSFIAVLTAFLLHELAHKAVAQRYGCFAEFRAYPMGLLLGVFTAAIGFLFAAPGAVMIAGPVTSRQHLRISAAGPGTNIAIASAFIGLAVALGTVGSAVTDLARILVGSVAFVNLFLGGFNLVPFPPLDGSKIFAIDKRIWVTMIALLVAVGYAGWALRVLVL